MIYIRDDDVLLTSSGHKDPFHQFKKIHRWIIECDKFIHVPTILVTEIQEFPDCIEYIKNETKEGRMKPEIHGFKHVDYASLSNREVDDHLSQCLDFFWTTFNIVPTKWYTPWGASSPDLENIASKYNLTLIDCSDLTNIGGFAQRAQNGENLENILQEKEIFYHWWIRGLKLKRIIETVKHGSWEAAKTANGDWF